MPPTSTQPYPAGAATSNRHNLTMSQVRSQALAQADPMKVYRAERDAKHRSVLEGYTILGFISSGTYGRVYKAQAKVPLPLPGGLAGGKDGDRGESTPGRPGDLPSANPNQIYAIKKFKPDKEGESITYTGISQSAIREIGLNRELSCAAAVGCVHRPNRQSSSTADETVLGTKKRKSSNAAELLLEAKRKSVHVARCRANLCENLAALKEVILEDKAIYMVFEYAEHDFLQIIHHHSQHLRYSIPERTLKSLLHQLLLGTAFLHRCHILHRDLKPANILVTSAGCVKIGDLGLARINRNPLQGLWNGDKVVVTIWYRSPELLLGARHYTAAIDLWAIGCIYAELLALRPIFKGEEAKPGDAKNLPSAAVTGLLGANVGGAGAGGGGIKNLPFQGDQMGKIVDVLGSPDKERWPDIIHMPEYAQFSRNERRVSTLAHWFKSRSDSPQGYNLLTELFEYDPKKRITAENALKHKYFWEGKDTPMKNAFAENKDTYPARRVSHEDNGDAKMGSQPPTMSAIQPAIPVNRTGASSAPFRPGTSGINSAGAAGGTGPRKRTRLGN